MTARAFRHVRFVAAGILLSMGLVTLIHGQPASRPASQPASQPTNAAAVQKLPTTRMVLAGQPFDLEMAVTVPQQAQGLMFRTEMGEREGMIFVFPRAEPRAFWMENTYILLDIAYLNDDGVILNIRKMYPRVRMPVPSAGPARYAIELNQGTAEKIGLKAGDRVELPASLR